MVREKSLTTELAFVVSKLSDGNFWASLKCSFPSLFFSLYAQLNDLQNPSNCKNAPYRATRTKQKTIEVIPFN